MNSTENYMATRKKNPAKISLAEIESAVDFDSVNKQLAELKSDRAGGRKTLATLLNPLRPELLKARGRNISYSALTEFLVKSGIPLSEPTLRQFLRSEDSGRAKRKRKQKEPEEIL
jgi:hypothetical protein